MIFLLHKTAKTNSKSNADSILALFSVLGLVGVGILARGVRGSLLNLSNPVYEEELIHLGWSYVNESSATLHQSSSGTGLYTVVG